MAETTMSHRVMETLQTHKILVDACFLMDRNFHRFIQDYSTVLQKNRMLIPKRVVQELQKIECQKDHRLESAQTALDSIKTSVSGGFAEVRGEASDDHTIADNVISRVVEQHIVHHNMVVLTNDRNLRDWIYRKRRAGCFHTKNSLLVIRFGPLRGDLHVWGGPGDAGSGTPRATTAPPVPRRSAPINRPRMPQSFARRSSVASELDTPLQAKDDVEQAAVVFLKGGRPIRLLAKVGSGGEGSVFETDQSEILCKLYHPERLTIGAQQKIELMTSRKLANPSICWPVETVVDGSGVFRGFLMPKASGEPLGHGLFILTVWLANHPSWTRKESAQLAIRVLERVDYLHRMRVLLGDINPMNILVKAENEIFFVDCDSFQVEGFPCPVGSPNFVAPEIQGVDFRHFLRSEEHELFALATLLFMIMMPGKCPYSHQGGADGAANIRKMHFPYPLGEKASAGAPEGAWRFCWSHLTRPIKEAFHQSFHEDFKGQPRILVKEWLSLFRNYETILNKSTAVFMGPVPHYGFDLSILPHNFRYVEGNGRPLPTRGETDLQRSVGRMAVTSTSVKCRRATPANAGTGLTASATYGALQNSVAPPQATANTTTTRSWPLNFPNLTTVQPQATVQTASTRVVRRVLPWIIFFIVALAGAACVVWYYWTPILEFLEVLLNLVGWIVFIVIFFFVVGKLKK